MESAKYNILIETGTDFAMPFTVYDDNDMPMDLTDARIEAHLREFEASPDYFEFSCINNGAGGRITITLPHETTSQIPYSYGVYDVKIEFPNGSIAYPLYGDVKVRNGITKSNDGTILFLVGINSFDDLPEVGSVNRMYYDYTNRIIYRWNGQNYVSAFYGGIADIHFKEHVDEYTDCYTIVYDNGKEFDYYVTAKGVQSVEKISSEGNVFSGIVDTYRMTFNNGTYVDYQITNGRMDVEAGIDIEYEAPETLVINTTDNTGKYAPKDGNAYVQRNGEWNKINHNISSDSNGVKIKVDWDSDIDNIPQAFPPTAHTHDDRYYTESEIDTKLNNKSDINHTHDDRYYTEAEINDKFDENTIIKSASGPIVSFNDSVAAPAGNVTVAIEPIQEGSGDPSPDNVRPITGWTGVKVMRTGKNLVEPKLPTETRNGITCTNNGDGSYTLNGTATATTYFRIDQSSSSLGDNLKSYKAGQYTLSGLYSGIALRVGQYGTYYNVLDFTSNNTKIINVDFDNCFIFLAINTGTTLNNVTIKPQLEYGSTATSYEPYQGDTYDISFGEAGTVYGGSLDVSSGKMTVTHGQIASYNGEMLPGKWISDRDVYAVGTTPTTGAQVVYELATPLTYQLTPTEVTTLLGQNNIWADTGDVEVSYFTEAGENIGKAFDNVSKSSKYDDDKTREMLTQSSESAMTASKNYTAGNLIIISNKLLRATANIATNGTITIGTNAEEVDLETVIAEKAEKILVAKLPFFSSSDLYNNTADFHNAMPRGKDITAYLTDGSLWKRINGTNGYSLFEDLYVGDYLTAGGQEYMIVDFDYYIRTGSVDITEHHLVMMPRGSMEIPAGTKLHGSNETLTLINTANAGVTVSSQETAINKKWNATMEAPNANSTAGGYKYSRMRQVIMRAADTIVINAFGADHAKPITVWYPNPADAAASGLASNAAWFANDDWTAPDRKSICDLPNETQIYGQQVWGRGSVYTNLGYEIGTDKWQFSLFRYNRNCANIRTNWWLRSVLSAINAATVTNGGSANNGGTSNTGGVRSRFVLVG